MQAGLQALVQNRTTFVIAHRPNTLSHCNVRFTLKEGQLT